MTSRPNTDKTVHQPKKFTIRPMFSRWRRAPLRLFQELFSGISQLLPNNTHYKFTDLLIPRFAVLEVVKLRRSEATAFW